MSCPYQCCWQWQPRAWVPKRAFANQKLHYLYSCRVVFWRFPMGDLVMPIKKSPYNSTWSLKINTRSLAWILIIHWHYLLPNDTAWTAAPAPRTPQPGMEKGDNKFCKILHKRSMCDRQERRPVASSRKSGQFNFSQKRLMAITPCIYMMPWIEGTHGPYLFFLALAYSWKGISGRSWVPKARRHWQESDQGVLVSGLQL